MKHTISFLLPILLIVCVFSFSCSIDPVDTKLIIINNSADTIVYEIVNDSILPNYRPSIYNDYLTNERGEKILNETNQVIHPNDSKTPSWPGKWEYFFKNNNPTKKLFLFVFSKQTLLKCSWDSIKQTNNFLKRYEFSELELIKLNWTIKYP